MQTSQSRSRARWIALLAGVASVVGVTAYTAGSTSAATKKPEPVQRTIYGTAAPVNAPGQSLTLQQVVIAPGAKLPTHFHEGTQLSTTR
jgi:quercetin dioxygenase-like cupin family protein